MGWFNVPGFWFCDGVIGDEHRVQTGHVVHLGTVHCKEVICFTQTVFRKSESWEITWTKQGL